MSTTALPTVAAPAALDQEKTGLGNYFIANYPPFSFWSREQLPQAMAALESPPRPDTPLGLYLHIPFCRKRCKFCYFRVYTDKNARDVDSYLRGLLREVELYGNVAAVAGRPLDFIYFGGGTPSYLSASQLDLLFDGTRRAMKWEAPREVTFECEPGTLQREKLVALKNQGVTRLSLGVENFSDAILEENGRAHRSPEIFKAYSWAKELGFAQINIDLIAGMVGETWPNWRDTVRRTLELQPDSVTIYQMELPFNTVYSKELRDDGQAAHPAIADWPTKRAWTEHAFAELQAAGYEISSGYTLVRSDKKAPFVYRDALWHGADLLGTGVASFGHVSGVHMQNVDQWDSYLQLLDEGKLPLNRALRLGPDEALIRELILQLKTGRLEVPYFQRKFGAAILEEFAPAWKGLAEEHLVTVAPDEVRLTKVGLLQVDRLLPRFFKEAHRSDRYT